MSKKNKKLTEEELELQNIKNELILKQQLEHFELYKKYIEPIQSKIFEYLKQICTLFLVVNGTILITAINLKNPAYNDLILKSFISLIILFFYIMMIFLGNALVFEFLLKRKQKEYVQRAYKILFIINISAYCFIAIQILSLTFGFEKIKSIIIN